MSANRSRKESILYANDLKKSKPTVCVFCDINPDSEQFISETKFFKVIRNIYPYSLWDGQVVYDHLMVVPKKHTDRLSELVDGAKAEFIDVTAPYEAEGYNLYARAPSSIIKTVVHQHTHLIKAAGPRRKFLIHTRKPYLRLHA